MEKAIELVAVPDAIGVYFFYNKEGSVMYVGKSIHLKSRLQSYFNPHNLENRKQEMMCNYHHFTYELAHHELHALLLEDEYIKKLLPEYNIKKKPTKKDRGDIVFAWLNKHKAKCQYNFIV